MMVAMHTLTRYAITTEKQTRRNLRHAIYTLCVNMEPRKKSFAKQNGQNKQKITDLRHLNMSVRSNHSTNSTFT